MIELLTEKINRTKDLVLTAIEDSALSENTIKAMNFERSLQRLDEGTFKIAVVAPFSAGKSTFINSLLEFDLLSMSILVETAAITTIKYGKEPKIEIHYRNGGSMILPKENETIEDLNDLKWQLKKYTVCQQR